MRILSLFMILLPLAEIIVFGVVVEWLGFWIALLLLLATSFTGLLIVRHQGFGMAAKMARMARTGTPPESELGRDAMTIVSGLLLLLPGFITDVFGLLLLIPPFRKLIAGSPIVRTRFSSASGTSYTETYRYGPRPEGSVVDLDADEFRRDAGSVQDDDDRANRIAPR